MRSRIDSRYGHIPIEGNSRDKKNTRSTLEKGEHRSSCLLFRYSILRAGRLFCRMVSGWLKAVCTTCALENRSEILPSKNSSSRAVYRNVKSRATRRNLRDSLRLFISSFSFIVSRVSIISRTVSRHLTLWNYQSGKNDQFIIFYTHNSVFLDTRVIFNVAILYCIINFFISLLQIFYFSNLRNKCNYFKLPAESIFSY